MTNTNENSRKADIQMRLTEFEMPPMQDVLIVGKMAPIGPEAARRMVDILSPDQYEIEKVEHALIEAVVIRKSLLSMIRRDKLVALILEEAEKIANEKMIIKVQIQITLEVHKSVEL
ncbi:hypothetical protein P22_3214 [Propionispora sp. 2/2-37]|uniref:hypothetical protein n=1 Tax=Propionispora sp. 2/2-37 TaxID=1677858 RepID=UPI0006C6FEC0|nr:hypothetical protein [Propionispora sp. 2/2-37]CUH97088.1 hypothetical protein P22_3214 [Propionispora sp. 2/2-37]